MRVYYSNQEYETGKHKIIQIWAEYLGIGMPDEYLSNYSVVEFDEFYNRSLAKSVYRYQDEDGILPDKYYVDGDGKLREADGTLVTINPNPQKESYKLSQLYGLTHEQLDTYLDNNMTDLASAREIMRKALHVILWLVKQTKLDE